MRQGSRVTLGRDSLGPAGPAQVAGRVAGRTGAAAAAARPDGARPGRAPLVLVLLATGVLALSACNRKQFVLTECVEGRPLVARTLDVAPPNC